MMLTNTTVGAWPLQRDILGVQDRLDLRHGVRRDRLRHLQWLTARNVVRYGVNLKYNMAWLTFVCTFLFFVYKSDSDFLLQSKC